MFVIGGDSLIDLIQKGETDGLPDYRAFPGGSAYNCARAVGRQTATSDLSTGWLGPLSTDTLGQLMLSTLGDSVTPLMAETSAPTSMAVVSFVDGQPAYQFYREGTADRAVTLDSLKAALPSDPSAFHVGSLALTGGDDAEAWTQLFEALNDQGIACTLDPNIRAAFITDRDAYAARLDRLIAAATLIKLSDEDCEWLYPDEPVEAAAEKLFARSNAAVLVLTLGSDGAVAFSKNGSERVGAAKLNGFGDTVGAGDTFMGSLIVKLNELGRLTRSNLADITLPELSLVLRYAATGAAINCERVGCNPPTQAEIVSRLMD